MNSAAEVQTAAAVPGSREAMQTIAHELRQPLSAIESTAYYLGLILPRGDGRAQTHVARLRELVEQSNWILSCGLQLADDTPPSPERVDLEEFLTGTIASAAVSGKPAFELAGNLPPVHLDPGRARALVINILALFQQLSGGAHRVSVKTERAADTAIDCVALDIAVGALGLTCEAALGPGAPLCLSGARKIVDAHGGTLTLAIDPRMGVRLRIALPCC